MNLFKLLFFEMFKYILKDYIVICQIHDLGSDFEVYYAYFLKYEIEI